MRLSLATAFCASLSLLGTGAIAGTIGSANLTASQELDPITMKPPASTATGTFSLDLNSAGDTLSYSLSFAGLTSPATMAHIHFGPPGVTGAPLFTLFDYGMPPSVSTTSASLTGTLTLADFMPDTADGIATLGQALTAIDAGDTYVNVHSVNYPAGEIRGQILVGGGSAVPEPMTVGLMALGALAVGAALRRRVMA